MTNRFIDVISKAGVLLFLSTMVCAQSYQLVWFETFSGTQLDESVWSFETGGHGWGNNELQYYTSSSDNVFIEDGKLVIQAKKENYSGKNYTSARVITMGKKTFKYGKMEARIKLPYGQGIWPAFWMLGQNFSSIGWPACGEIDIMEMIGGGTNDRTIYGTAHWSDNGSHASYGGKKSISSGIFADDFHIFGIEWDETAIRWFLDGEQYHVIDITPSGLSEFHNEYFFILNVAVGGEWPGSPDGTTVFPQRMEVDYIRVYQEVSTDVEDEAVPASFDEISVYPNPFNNQATIVVNSERGSDHLSRLCIVNLLGEVVYSDKVKLVAGKNKFSFEAPAGLNSGVYFLNLNSGSKLLSTKIIYLK